MRRHTLEGTWSVAACTDRFALLNHRLPALPGDTGQAPARSELFLWDMKSGSRRLVVPGALAGKDMGIVWGAVSDAAWIIWQERDSLFTGRWRLYALRFDPSSLAPGRPRLVVRGSDQGTFPPVFALVGRRVVYTAHAFDSGTPPSGSVQVVDLADGSRRALYWWRASPAYFSPGGDGTVLIGEYLLDARRVRVHLMTFDPVATRLLRVTILDPGKPIGIAGVKLPWSLWWSGEGGSIKFWLQKLNGKMTRLYGHVEKPQFIAGYLIYSNGPPGLLLALRLRDLKKLVVAGETDYHSDIWAGGPHMFIVGDQTDGSTELRAYMVE